MPLSPTSNISERRSGPSISPFYTPMRECHLLWKIGVAILLLASSPGSLACPKGAGAPLPARRLVLVPGDAGPGHRPRSGRVAIHGGSVHVYSPGGTVHRPCLGGRKDRCQAARMENPAIIVLSLVALSGLLFLARAQVETWKNSVTLFEHALAVTEVNPVARPQHRGLYLDKMTVKRPCLIF